MSINIIGSNGKELTLITKNIIINKFDNISSQYNLLIKKYNNQINTTIINKKKYNHLVNQLIKLFNFTDIESLIFYINDINNTNNLEKVLWNIIEQFNLYKKLNDCLLKIIDKLILLKIIDKKELLNLDNNYYLTFVFINNKLQYLDNENINDNVNIIKDQISNLKKELLKFKNIKIKESKISIYFDNNIYNDKFMEKFISSINNTFYRINIIKSNILNIDNIINIIIENLYNIYIKI
jgi:hypothetical protein